MELIKRYQELQSQIEWIEKQLKNKEYVGTGLLLNLTIGTDGPCISMQIGSFSGIEKDLLLLLAMGLKENQKNIFDLIERDFRDLEKFLRDK